MFRKITMASLLISLVMTNLFSASDGWKRYLPMVNFIKGVDFYEGDKHGDFKHNLVVALDDGSYWKIHPKDQHTFGRWKMDDIVQVQRRTSFYWFKREHKFELLNRNLNETVRVMLVQYPINPLIILDSNVYVSKQTLKSYPTRDAFGNITYVYYWVYEYEKKLFLNDGSIWILTRDFDHFKTGYEVYLGGNNQETGVSFFLISGKEREAKVSKVRWGS